jgi:hypothetical protein
MSELGDKRKRFTQYLAMLILEMIKQGYEPMIGKEGLKHMEGSLHYEGLAKDIDLTKDGKYLDKTEDHYIFGVYWESLNPGCRWGGRFKKGADGNHYSITYLGRS